MNVFSVLARAFAHDLNNLLMVITGCTELALDRLPQDSPASRNLLEIRTASQRACELSTEMLSFFAGGPRNSQLVSVNSVVQETCRMLSRGMGRTLQLQVVLGGELGQVLIDARQVQLLLLNLAIGARDANPHSAKLVVQTRAFDLDSLPVISIRLPPGKYAQLSIGFEGRATVSAPADLDPGQWITDSDMQMIEQVVEENHGFLFVDAKSGENAVVNIYLPLAHAEAHPAGPVQTSDHVSPPPCETLLIVDDGSVIRSAVAESLSEAGYNVLSAGNGKEALEKIQAHPGTVDLVITDVEMPEMSGPELAEKLALIYPEMKVLFVSGCAEDAELNQAAAASRTNFLPKPFSFQTLAQKVRQVLNSPGNARTARAGTG